MNELKDVLITATGWGGTMDTLRYSPDSMEMAIKDAAVLAQNVSIQKVEVSRIMHIFVHEDLKQR